ncbi:trypsin theta-like isoform X2 [Nymphalis io]|uniref:trypsin theta-like isoform X2 n=1 Tax=Inachis io TaxID=171585 RepID=UPI00216A7544|nr:trypsin theta-like isoform X2 [Nymphalis io]
MLHLLKLRVCLFYCLHHVCSGLLNSSLEGRIVKGYKVEIDQYPHSVFLHFLKDIPTACGSSLVMDRAVITAAHCLNELKYRNGRITAFMGSTIPLHAKLVRRVVDYRIHPHYNAKKGRYNLGIAFFNNRVTLNHFVKKVPIAIIAPKPGDGLFTSGWGKQILKKLPDYSDLRHLKVSKQMLITDRECEHYTNFRMSSAYFCTVSINGYHYQYFRMSVSQ